MESGENVKRETNNGTFDIINNKILRSSRLNTICDKPEDIDITATNSNSCESKNGFQGNNLTTIHDRDKLPCEWWGLNTRKDQDEMKPNICIE